jgi:hypothetical protein
MKRYRVTAAFSEIPQESPGGLAELCCKVEEPNGVMRGKAEGAKIEWRPRKIEMPATHNAHYRKLQAA